MIKPCFVLLLLLGSLVGCQPQRVPDTAAQPSSGTETARQAVVDYIQKQPNASLYQTDSARVMDAGTAWQVLVPRTDWAGRMPNAAAFEVDKQTGAVSTLRVK